MVTLGDVLCVAGYRTSLEKMSYCKLLACFGRFAILNPVDTNQNIFEFKNLHLNGHIINVQAEKLISMTFTSLEDGFEWLLKTTKAALLRKTYKDEGINADKHKTNLNVSQWNYDDEINLDEFKRSHVLIDAFMHLHLLQEVPIRAPYQSVVCISSLEPYLRDRIDFLENFTGTFYFLSGARGLFNSEESLPFILADWFDKPTQVVDIKNVLDKHKSFDDPLNWTQNLTALKKEILTAIGEEKWCDASSRSWYYQAKDVYEAFSKSMGHESVRDWPVAMDLLIYLVKTKRKKVPGFLEKVSFISILSQGKNGRLPTSEDFIAELFQHYGNELLKTDKPPLFIICNGTHRIHYLMQYLKYNEEYFNSLTQYTIKIKLKNFLTSTSYQKLSELDEDKNICVAGPAAKNISLSRVSDILARTLWALEPKVKERISYYSLINHDLPRSANYHSDIRIKYIKEITHYKSWNKYLQLIRAVINLSFAYNHDHDHIKTSGLMNFVVSMQKKIKNILNDENNNLLHQCLLINFERFLARTSKINDNILPVLNNINEVNRTILFYFRNIIKSRFSKIKQPSQSDLISIYHLNSRFLQSFLKSVIFQSKLLLNKHPNLFFGFLGSNSGGQSTLYSDIEFYILISSSDQFQDALNITKTMLMLILNLQETILRSLGIRELASDGKEFNLLDKEFDALSYRGLSFDFNDIKDACKTPLGAKWQKNVYFRLINTPSNMAQFRQKSIEFNFYFPQMLSLSKPLCGDYNLFREYKNDLIKPNKINSKEYCLNLLKKDIDQYVVYLQEFDSKEVIAHKNYFYRPIISLIDGLYIALSPTRNQSAYHKLLVLHQHGLLTKKQVAFLENSLTLVLYLRMKQHHHWKQNFYFFKKGDVDTKKLCVMAQGLLEIYQEIKLNIESKDSQLSKRIYNINGACKLKSKL